MTLTKKILMQQMRERTLELAQDNNNDEYDPKDIQAISSGSNDLLWRFALFDLECDDSVTEKTSLEHVQVDRAVETLLRTLRWRRKFGLHQYKVSDVPREFYECKVFTETLYREEKCYIFFIRTCRHKNISAAVRALVTKCIMCELEKKIRQFEHEYENGIQDLRMISVLDLSNIKYSSLDINFLIEAVNILAKHFPSTLQELWFFNAPWFVKPLFPFFQKGVPSAFSRRCRIMNLDDAISTLGEHLIPKFMGGCCPIEPDLEVPEESTPLDKYAERNILNKDDISKLKQHLISLAKV